MAYVTAACVIAKRPDGSDAYFYQGVELPDGLREGEVDRLIEAGLVAASEDEKPARKSTTK